MKLTDLSHGETAKTLEITGDCDQATRLRAMGLLPGRTIRRQNTAPLGDPVAYVVDGQKISIRKAEADLVEIELV